MLETMCGWALCAGAAYALLFVNLTGDGSLFNSALGVLQNAAPQARSNVATSRYVIPAKPVDLVDEAQNRMLMIPETAQKAIAVTVAAPQMGRIETMADAPADITAAAPKDWRVHIRGELPNFAVYGAAEQTSSAVAGAKTGGSAFAAAARPTPSAAGSAYRAAAADPEATPRPGISDRATGVRAEGGDGLQNFLGRR